MFEMPNNNILLFIKTPPPVTGATSMNKSVHDSELLNRFFNIRSICISYMKNRSEMGKWKIRKLFIFIGILKKLISELRKHRPVFVYFQLSPHGVAFFRDLIYVVIIKAYKIKIVYHLHGKGINEKITIFKYFYRYAFNKEYVICLSSLLTYDIADVFSGQIFIVPNGIPDIKIEDYKGNPGKVIRLLYLSNLIKSKGILDYIEAMKLLDEKGYEYEGLIVGAEADLTKDELNEILRDKGIIGKVKYLGPKYSELKNSTLANSDILVFPTQNETFGIVNLEAMQFAKPIISTRLAAIPEIVDDGITGFIVDINSPKQIAEKIEILINDPDLRRRMGEAGRKKYEERYTINKFEENMKVVFREALDDIISKNKTKIK